jgi:hypothetical protein
MAKIKSNNGIHVGFNEVHVVRKVPCDTLNAYQKGVGEMSIFICKGKITIWLDPHPQLPNGDMPETIMSFKEFYQFLYKAIKTHKKKKGN